MKKQIIYVLFCVATMSWISIEINAQRLPRLPPRLPQPPVVKPPIVRAPVRPIFNSAAGKTNVNPGTFRAPVSTSTPRNITSIKGSRATHFPLGGGTANKARVPVKSPAIKPPVKKKYVAKNNPQIVKYEKKKSLKLRKKEARAAKRERKKNTVNADKKKGSENSKKARKSTEHDHQVSQSRKKREQNRKFGYKWKK